MYIAVRLYTVISIIYIVVRLCQPSNQEVAILFASLSDYLTEVLYAHS